MALKKTVGEISTGDQPRRLISMLSSQTKLCLRSKSEAQCREYKF